MGKLIQLSASNHFGDCPKCKKNDGHLNVGRDHWYYCKRHQVKWFVGSNIFPDWLDETFDTWRQNEALLECFMEIEPLQKHKFTVDENEFFNSRRKTQLQMLLLTDEHLK